MTSPTKLFAITTANNNHNFFFIVGILYSFHTNNSSTSKGFGKISKKTKNM